MFQMTVIGIQKKITRHGPKKENDSCLSREKIDNRNISIDYLHFGANQQDFRITMIPVLKNHQRSL